MDAKGIKDDLRRMMLAAAGAVGMAADEAQKIANKLVARGEIAEKDAKAVLEKIAASRPGQAAKKAVKAADRGVEAILERLRLPTRNDMDALQKKIDALNEKLDKMTGGSK